MDCKQKVLRYSLIFLIFFISKIAVAELNGFTAIYKLQSFSRTQATAPTRLSINNDHYRFESHIQPVGWIGIIYSVNRYEFSEGLLKNNQLIPQKYSYQHSERIKSDRQVDVLFDNQQKIITNFHKHLNNKWKMVSVDQVQDRLSSQLSLMLALQQSGVPFSQQNFVFSIADGGRLKQYTYNILAEEKLETPLGILNTIKLEHHRSNQEGIMIIWCAEEFAYLPVKIIQRQTDLPDYISIIDSYKKE